MAGELTPGQAARPGEQATLATQRNTYSSEATGSGGLRDAGMLMASLSHKLTESDSSEFAAPWEPPRRASVEVSSALSSGSRVCFHPAGPPPSMGAAHSNPASQIDPPRLPSLLCPRNSLSEDSVSKCIPGA